MKARSVAVALMFGLLTGNVDAAYMPVGVQNNVDVSTVLAGGWTQCYDATMSVFIGYNAESVLNSCTGTDIMMAGRVTGSSTLLVLAQTTLADAPRVHIRTSRTGPCGTSIPICRGVSQI